MNILQIYELTQYAINCGGDENEIISYIKINYSQLKACREVMANGVKHILVNDNDFKTYFKNKKDDYWDKIAEMKNISVESFFLKA